MFELEQKRIENQIEKICVEEGLPQIAVKWKWIPFSGEWGISTSFFEMAASEARSGKKIIVGQRAQEIAALVAEKLGQPVGFSRLEAVRGYLNLYFSSVEYANKVIDTVFQEGAYFGKLPSVNEKVMVEFSQPNTHKAFHVGHLRNVILGNAVCNIVEAAGYDVVRTNYIGDIGLHVIKWLWNYINFHNGEEPGEDKVRWMTQIYSEADQRFQDPENEAKVRQLFLRWNAREPEIVDLWKKTREWSMQGFQQIYDLLGVRFDHYYYESDVEDSGIEVVDRLIEAGLAVDGRPDEAVFIPLDEKLGTKDVYRVLVILRSDGTSLYSTKDLSLAIKKFEDFGLDHSIYVIDVRQSLYMKQIFKTLELLDYDWANNCEHLAYEIVNLPGNVTMSSRDGTVVLLEDLVREATQRALDIVKVKNPDLSAEEQENIARIVALGAIKYSMLSRDNQKIVTFDWDSALDFNGQAAPYIQYAFVRANSILKKVNNVVPEISIPAYEMAPAEIQLIDLISRMPNEIERSAAERRPLWIANLAYDLARSFNDFYNQCPVLKAEPEIRDARLKIVAAAKQAIANSLGLLGIQTPDIM
jgi:arginyl-tRNA synthetase